MSAKSIAKKAWLSLSALRLIPHILLLKCHPERETIELDLARWIKELGPCLDLGAKPGAASGGIYPFIQLLTFYPEYRTLFYYRIGWASRIMYPLCRPMPLLSISKVEQGIGPGFFIMHGRASGVAAQKIGSNCRIFQHVSIGYLNESDKPVLGDNVTIFAGAKVLGRVTVGDNSIVGANAVVVKDVPANCTVVGVPAYIVRRNGVKLKEPL